MKSRIQLLVLMALFIVLRTPALTRDLAFEESTYLLPGRSLLLGHGFTAYIGELLPNFSPFHKPPLASLLPGMFSFLSLDWIHAGRLFSLLTSLWISFFPFIFLNSFLGSIVAIFSPFLLSASAQIQTDPSVGLLGVSIVCWSILIGRHEKKKKSLLLTLGFSVLWCGKVELAICATTALFACAIIIPKLRTRENVIELLGANTVGIIALFLLSGLLGLTTHYKFHVPFMQIISTMTGISSQVGAQVGASGTQFSRLEIFRDLNYQKFFHLAFGCLIVIFGSIFLRKSEEREKNTIYQLLSISITVFAIYFLGGWRGDGFPRYFLSCVPPLVFAFSLIEKHINFSLQKTLIAGAFILSFWSRDLERLRTQQGIAGIGSKTGYREAALIVKSFTDPNDLIVAPEPCGAYLDNRKTLIDFTLSEPLSRHDEKLQKFETEVRAVITDLDPENPTHEPDRLLSQFLSKFLKQELIRLNVGTFRVLIWPHRKVY